MYILFYDHQYRHFTCSFIFTCVVHLLMLLSLELLWKQGYQWLTWTSIYCSVSQMSSFCLFVTRAIVTPEQVTRWAQPPEAALALLASLLTPRSQLLEVSGMIFSSGVHQVTSIDFSLLSSAKPSTQGRVSAAQPAPTGSEIREYMGLVRLLDHHYWSNTKTVVVFTALNQTKF